MSTLDWAVFIMFAGLVLLGVNGLRHQWRSRHESVWNRAPGWWLWGEETFRAWVRTQPIAIAIIAVADVIFLLGKLGVYDSDGASFWAGAFLIALLLLLFLLATTVTFYNRPRWVIVPRLRDERGIVDAYRQRRRRPRRT